MNRVYIEDEGRNIIIDSKDKMCGGYSFYDDGRVEQLTNKEIFDIFKDFLLSEDNKKLPNEGEYKVYLDNKTGFKHYFHNGEESFIMFFLNNGEDATAYREEKKKEKKEIVLNDSTAKPYETTKEKFFKIRRKIIRSTCMALLMVMVSAFTTNELMVFRKEDKATHYLRKNDMFPFFNYIIDNIRTSPNRLMGKINCSIYLEEDEKFFLANKDFLEDIAPYINSSEYAKSIFSYRFNDVLIDAYDNTNTGDAGYFSWDQPNVLHIAEKYVKEKYTNPRFWDILSHEYIHSCQVCSYFNIIKESCAEIISYEYFDNSPLNSYSEEVYLMRKLMEIIGPEPIWRYNFAGSFDEIEKAVKPYLTEFEYEVFLYDLHRPNITSPDYDENEVRLKHESLDYLLDILYERKNGKSSDEDLVIPHLRDKRLVRHYFNGRKMKEYGSFVRTPDPYIEEKMTLEEAVKNQIVFIAQNDEEGNEINITWAEYINSTYNVDRGLFFKSRICETFNMYLNDEGTYDVIIKLYGNVMPLEDAVRQGLIYIYQKDEDGNIFDVSLEDYLESNYDYDLGLKYGTNEDIDFSLFLGNDRRLHAYIKTYEKGCAINFPTVEEKFDRSLLIK